MTSNYAKCPVCRDYDFLDSHVCKPSWQAIRPEYRDEDDFELVYANDSEDAALKYAQDKFSEWEYPTDIEIWVRKSEDDPWEKYDIEVHPVPEFSATRKEPVSTEEEKQGGN